MLYVSVYIHTQCIVNKTISYLYNVAKTEPLQTRGFFAEDHCYLYVVALFLKDVSGTFSVSCVEAVAQTRKE